MVNILFHQAIDIFEHLTSRQVEEGFVYRGHGKAEYELVPSFQRLSGKNRFLSLDDAAQLTASSWSYRVFYRTANQMGLPLPSVSNEKHHNYASESPIDALLDFTDEAEGEYDFDDLEIMAFAQHYQIPTQLLDWSRSPLAAMYFAASSALQQIVDFARENLVFDQYADDQVAESVRQKLREDIEVKRLSIWQANSLALNELSRQRHVMETDAEDTYTIRFFTPRTQGNQNIVAQQGLFSIHCPEKMSFEYRYAETPPKCLSEVVAEHEKWTSGRESASSFLTSAQSKGLLNEFSLPYSQVVNLLRLLDRSGFHAALIYPGHQGCAKLVEERAAISMVNRLL